MENAGEGHLIEVLEYLKGLEDIENTNVFTSEQWEEIEERRRKVKAGISKGIPWEKVRQNILTNLKDRK